MQVQYTDRIKAIVEFLGPRLSAEELTNIWNLGEGGENSHVQVRNRVQSNWMNIYLTYSNGFSLILS